MPNTYPETADIESSTDQYAKRFAGAAGAWMLEQQSLRLSESLQELPSSGLAIDVGGGHGQTEPLLRKAGFETLVTGSASSCSKRLDEGTQFKVANSLELPLEDQEVEVAISFRLVTHCESWPALIAELCRVSKHRVVIDYPAKASVNMVADLFFGFKKGLEKDTRTYQCFSHRQISEAFARHGFTETRRHPQFFFPMVLHRMLKSPKLSRILEGVAAAIGLRHLFGSPVVLEARRNEA